jgi:hypothetical protein
LSNNKPSQLLNNPNMLQLEELLLQLQELLSIQLMDKDGE